MNKLTSDEITIDTNVFEHLLNEGCRFNEDGHVKHLLQRLITDKIRLCIDAEEIIRGEYNNQLRTQISTTDDTDNLRQILQYWMDNNNQEEIDSSTRSNRRLHDMIRTIIRGGGERVDRCFVAVAFIRGKVFISNDEAHIVKGSEREVSSRSWRRDRLLHATRSMRPRGAAIYFSSEAYSACS